MRYRDSYVLSLSLLVLLACGGGSERRVGFVEVAFQAGLDFQHTSGAKGDYFLFETMGAGGAFMDYDGDGWLDIYLVNGFDLTPWYGVFRPVNLVKEDSSGYWVAEEYKPPLRFTGQVDSTVFLLHQDLTNKVISNRLYRNSGDASFSDYTLKTGTGNTGYGMGCSVGDYDNDGDPDLYVTNFGTNALYKNDAATGHFTDVGVTTGVDDAHWSSSAAFFDYDNDGDLDLYVSNYLDLSLANNRICGVAVSSAKSALGKALRVPLGKRTYCSPRRYNGAPDILYRNEEDGSFSDVSQSAGIFSPFGKGLGVVAADFNNDGLQDLYVANDGTRNFLYANQGDATFKNIAIGAGAAYNNDGQPEAGMGLAAADVDGDTDLDLLVTNFSRESNTLYSNQGDNRFVDHSDAAGLQQSTLLPLGFGTFFFDYDNDADQDLFVANGHVLDRVVWQDQELSYKQANQLFANDGQGRFSDISLKAGSAFERLLVSRGAAYGDYDNDGDQDILVSNVNGAVGLYRNEWNANGQWLSIQLVGTQVNRDGVGALVRLWCNERLQVQHKLGGGSYLSASDKRIHFGLGTCGLVDRLEIFWPDGSRQQYTNLKVNQFMLIEQEL